MEYERGMVSDRFQRLARCPGLTSKEPFRVSRSTVEKSTGVTISFEDDDFA